MSDLSAAASQLSGTQKSAILMMLLGEDEAADLLKHLAPREVQQLGQAMLSVADVDQDTVNHVLDEFILAAREQTSLGLGTGPYVRNVMEKALGADKAGSVLGRMAPSSPHSGIEILDWMDAHSIASTITGEHPQVIAAVLSHLEPELAAEVLQQLPEAVQADALLRVATLDTIAPDALTELEHVIQRRIQTGSKARPASAGGTAAAAKIINSVRGGTDRLITQLTSLDEEVGQTVQDQMFTFDSLLSLDARGMQALMAAVDTQVLVVALKGADERLCAKMLASISQRAAQSIRDEMETRGPVRVAEVQEAQRQILTTARQLADSGNIMLGSGDGYV